MSKQIDSRPFYVVFATFFIALGTYLAAGSQNMLFHLLTALGIGSFVMIFMSRKSSSEQDSTTRKRNLIVGTVIFLLAFVIIWITFENRFDLETMAKTKKHIKED